MHAIGLPLEQYISNTILSIYQGTFLCEIFVPHGLRVKPSHMIDHSVWHPSVVGVASALLCPYYGNNVVLYNHAKSFALHSRLWKVKTQALCTL